MKRIKRLICILMLLPAALVLAQSNGRKLTAARPFNQALGRKLFNGQCALCHGIEGTGGRGPALNVPTLKRANTTAELFKVIKSGIPDSEMPDFWSLSDNEVRQVASYVQSLGRAKRVSLAGDPMRGKGLYEVNCITCHIVRGQGGVSGPELTEIGLRRSPAYLREAVVDPNTSLPEGFLVVTAVTPDGKTSRGVRINEDSFTIQLRDAANRVHSLRKADLKELKKEFGISTMPSFKDAFTKAELDDLVAYLYSLRGDK